MVKILTVKNMNNYIIKIEDIENSKNKSMQVDFEDFISEIKTKNPIVASIELQSLGEFIEAKGTVQGCALLECDLCLEEFEYEFDVEIQETYAKNSLQEEYSQETELKDGEFVTDLRGAKEIDIYDLLYQSVILDFPNKKVCGINCNGGDIFIREECEPERETDPRLAVFKTIKVDK